MNNIGTLNLDYIFKRLKKKDIKKLMKISKYFKTLAVKNISININRLYSCHRRTFEHFIKQYGHLIKGLLFDKHFFINMKIKIKMWYCIIENCRNIKYIYFNIAFFPFKKIHYNENIKNVISSAFKQRDVTIDTFLNWLNITNSIKHLNVYNNFLPLYMQSREFVNLKKLTLYYSNNSENLIYKLTQLKLYNLIKLITYSDDNFPDDNFPLHYMLTLCKLKYLFLNVMNLIFNQSYVYNLKIKNKGYNLKELYITKVDSSLLTTVFRIFPKLEILGTNSDYCEPNSIEKTPINLNELRFEKIVLKDGIFKNHQYTNVKTITISNVQNCNQLVEIYPNLIKLKIEQYEFDGKYLEICQFPIVDFLIHCPHFKFNLSKICPKVKQIFIRSLYYPKIKNTVIDFHKFKRLNYFINEYKLNYNQFKSLYMKNIGVIKKNHDLIRLFYDIYILKFVRKDIRITINCK